MKHLSRKFFRNINNRGLQFSDVLIILIIIAIAGYLGLKQDEAPMIETANANIIAGRARVGDGDTITIKNERIRIIGIDAPELSQPCFLNKERIACGVLSKKHMIKLINNRPVRCKWIERDQYGRILGRCTAGDSDLNRTMVEDGWAVSYSDYPAEERFARKEKRGFWQWRMQRPYDYRRANPWRK